MTTNNPIIAIASENWVRGPNIGLSPERTQELYAQAKERIAAENKAKEEAKVRKLAKKGKLPHKEIGDEDDDSHYSQAGYPVEREEDKKGGAFGWIKALRKKH